MTMLQTSKPRGDVNPLARHWPAVRRMVGLILLASLAFAFLIPILWMTVLSFQAGEKMFQLRTEWIPTVWHPENFPNALSRAAFVQYFMNSGIVSLTVMVTNVVFCTLAGYGLAKFRFRGSGLMLLLILSTLMLPLEVMGMPFHFSPGEGPVIEKPVRTAEDVKVLRTDRAADLGYVA